MLTTSAQIVALGNLPDEGNEERISEYAAIAENKLREMIGSDLYDAVAGDAFYADDKTKLARAEAFLTLSELAPVLNLRINPNDGGFVSSVGFGESKNSLLGFNEVQDIAAMFRAKADIIIAEYVVIGDDETDEIGQGDNIGWFSI